MIRKILWLLIFILAAIAIYILLFKPDYLVLGPPAYQISSEKIDQQCTGHETTGRCADKCPNQTDTLKGFDPQTGAAICQTNTLSQPTPIQTINPVFSGK